MLYFKLKKFEGDKYYYCYQISPNGKVKNRAFRYPVRQVKNGIYQYRKDWFFGLIKREAWSKEGVPADIINSMKERRDWEFLAVMCVVIGICAIIGLIISNGGK